MLQVVPEAQVWAAICCSIEARGLPSVVRAVWADSPAQGVATKRKASRAIAAIGLSLRCRLVNRFNGLAALDSTELDALDELRVFHSNPTPGRAIV